MNTTFRQVWHLAEYPGYFYEIHGNHVWAHTPNRKSHEAVPFSRWRDARDWLIEEAKKGMAEVNSPFAYRKKHVEIEAFQFIREAATDQYPWPDWLRRAAKKEAPRDGAFAPHGWEERWVLYKDHSARLVEWNDFIIRDENGTLTTCDPSIFHEIYQKA